MSTLFGDASWERRFILSDKTTTARIKDEEQRGMLLTGMQNNVASIGRRYRPPNIVYINIDDSGIHQRCASGEFPCG